MQPDCGEDLSKCMQWLMTSHVRRYHKHFGTSGHVWQGRFKSFIIQEDNHLLTVTRYIEGNPIRAGLVEFAEDWRWSSYLERQGKDPKNLIALLPIRTPTNWADFVNTAQTQVEMTKLQESINRQSPFGVSEWQQKIGHQLGLASTLRPVGRPRKLVKK